MSTERHEEPAVLQALEEVQEALRTEDHAQGPLSRENARLLARLEELQAERERLLYLVDEAGGGPSLSAPRLPESLEPPFVVQSQAFRYQLARQFLLMPVAVVFMLALGWNQGIKARVFCLALLLLVVAYQGVKFWWGRWRARWRFETHGFELGGLGRFLSYSDVLDVGVHVSASQRRRGLGTLVVRFKTWPGTPGPLCVQMKDVPEPERLAAWLQAKRSRTA